MYYDLNKPQKALCDLMSDISEESWAAGWMDGLEYALWHMVQHGPVRYGFKFVYEQIIQQLKHLSEQAGCWIVFDDATDERAVSLSDW
jgi:HJR/Mrr/RecB family endonuclease